MIIARKKPVEEIITEIDPYDRILILGCNECVTVCEAGGKKEVEILASALTLHYQARGKAKTFGKATLERQCDREYLEEIRGRIHNYDAVLSLACGVGVQFAAETYTATPLLPGVDTVCLGANEERGLWTERCQACGSCVLARTGGICPVSRCAKRVMNGPCGGSANGKCELGPDTDCAWQLIIDRLKALGRLEDYEQVAPIKDWSTDRAGGPRTITREDIQL
ncbi:MAG: methylenetetrahydrofolate reductase C-terminal domain-containing protein [Desulfobacter sp.]|nr:MAG: methylenetetrahydrofolate reductase C-terminal domain-containing protein [Desulfobacter sp.]